MFGSNPEAIFHFHSNLLLDRARTETLHRAIADAVRPGDVVLDLGSGTGILSFFACEAGARRVYAVESGDVAELSKLLCVANGLQDRIVVLNHSSYNVVLPEKVDAIITDTFHTFGLQDGLLGSIIDARRRLLKTDGTIVPRSIELFVALVELPDVYRRFDVWTAAQYGFDFSPGREFATNNLYSIPVEADVFQKAWLGPPGSLIHIRLSDVETSNVGGQATLTTTRSGVMHGLGGWFAAELGDGNVLSNSPDIRTVSWKYAFFPLDRPMMLGVGESISVRIDTCDGATWRWEVERAGGSARQRTTFRGFPWSAEGFHKLSPGYAPKRTPIGDAELFVLGLLDGHRMITDLEEELRRRYPEQFSTPESAASFVQDIAWRCS
ncbi:MAG: 50S ribosomal protein L11 methyltransferase [Acidobacteriota bacterium]